MSIEMLGLPATVSLAVIATLGYVMSRRVTPVVVEENAARQDMKRAQAVIAQLAAISQQMRKSLAQHHSTVMQFKSRLDEMQTQGDQISLQDLSLEADRILVPTEQLATSIAEAYEGIRRQTQQLATAKKRVDRLTGVGDKMSLTENVELMLGLRKKCDVPFSIALFDIDCFAPFNARAGRAAGDNLLCTLAGILDSRSRDCDQVARLEGDRFVVLLPGTNEAGAIAFTRRMQSYIDAGMPMACSVSVAEATKDDSYLSLIGRCQQVLLQTRLSRKGNLRLHGEQSIAPASSMRTADVKSDLLSK